MYVCGVIHVTKSWCSYDGCEVRELPESFFTPTADEIKVSQATLASRAQALNNAPLQLRATRQAAEKAKKDRWPNVGRGYHWNKIRAYNCHRPLFVSDLAIALSLRRYFHRAIGYSLSIPSSVHPSAMT